MIIPREVKKIIKKLESHNFEGYIVGGCVRDLLRGVKPKDWDIATDAKPEEIQKIFPDSFYKNKFGTVTAKTEAEEPTLKEIEITTYRIDEQYSDKRHPDKVRFAASLKEDLARRDFTVNAMAIGLSQIANRKSQKKGKQKLKIIDYFGGKKDLKNKIIRAVGKPEKRFGEDALRLLRAVRFAVSLEFKIEPKTTEAIKKNGGWLKAISKERIRDEVVKILESVRPDKGILLLKDTGLLKYVFPELEKGVGVSQNRHHIYTIFTHSVLSLKYAAKRKYNLPVRIAALFHDIAKPQTKRGEGPDSTFYNHDIVGAKMAIRALERLKFPKDLIEKVAHLIRNHMFFYNVDEVSEAGVRRLVHRVGRENMKELLDLRIADRLGSGCPKAIPYKLRHLEYLIEKTSRDPISAKMLEVDGNEIMKILKIKPGPRIGLVLNALLAEVIDEPKLNKKETLKKRVKELDKLTDKELQDKVKRVEEKKEEVDLEIKAKHFIK